VRWLGLLIAGLFAAAPGHAQPLSTDTTQLHVLRGHYATADAQYQQVHANCASLLDEVLGYVGPVEAPMQPRDDACAAFADPGRRMGTNTSWRACSVRFFDAYDAKRAEYRACFDQEEQLGRTRLELYRQIASLDRRLRETALARASAPAPVPGWLGVKIEDLNSQRAAQLGFAGQPGAYVVGTFDRSPASKAGVREGDMITAFDGRPVRASSDLLNYAQGILAGQTIALDVIRAGTLRTVYVAIEARR